MRITRPAAIGAATAIVAAIAVPLLTLPASAATAPPWEPDPNALGSLIFYSCTNPSVASTCSVVTGGTNLNHIADYIQASTPDPSTPPGNKATLQFAAPVPNTPTLNFTVGPASANTLFPNANAPYTGPNPLITIAPTDADLLAFVTGQQPQTAPGFANVYQVRLVTTSAAGGGTQPSFTYWEVDVAVDQTAGTWTEIYPNQGSTGKTTTTTVTASPTPGVQHSPVTLTATVTASDNTHPAGTVQFSQDGIEVGGPENVDTTTGAATLTTSALSPSKPNGTKLTAVFTPASANYDPSTSAAFTYTVNPVANKPTLSGPHQAGKTETCSDGTLAFGVTASYSWLAGTTKIGTGAKLTVPGSAFNKELTCVASVSDGGGPANSATSDAVKVLLGAKLTVKTKPTLSGPHRVGTTERVKHGTWSQTATFKYQWLLNGKVIRHATKSSLKLTRADKGKKISCRVTAHATGFANGTATTSSVKVS